VSRTLYDDVPESPQVVEAIQQIEDDEVKQAQLVEQMAATGGWAIVREFLLSQIEGIKEALVDEEDAEKIRRLQQSAKAYSNVVGFVHSQQELVVSERVSRSETSR
jgi:hypothetical protein